MRTLLASILFVFVSIFAGAAHGADVKLGVVFGYTGPIESLTPQNGGRRRTCDEGSQ